MPLLPSRRPLLRTGLALGALLLAVALTACGSDGEETDSSPTSAADESASGPSGTGADEETTTTLTRNEGLRGVRYCEVLVLFEEEGQYRANVWNTMGLSDCPQEQWEALDTDAIASDQGALLAIENGPRYWTLDVIEQGMRATAEETTFGEIPMFLAADVRLGSELPDQTPYVERTVERDTVFEWAAGEVTYQLTDPDGTVYVMQSYSTQIDPTMSPDALPGLGERLELPEGWTYAEVVPTEALRLLSDSGDATVVRDELQNTYQRFDDL